MTERQLHVGAWITVAALLAGIWQLAKHAGAQQERDRRLADSLSAVQAHLDSATDAARESVTVQHRREAAAAQLANVRETALRAAQGNVARLRAIVGDSLSAAQNVAFDSLEAAHATAESLLVASRDSYRALFLTASAERDALAGLLRASQAQAAGLQQALIAARRKPWTQSAPFKVVTLALALRGAAAVVGH